MRIFLTIICNLKVRKALAAKGGYWLWNLWQQRFLNKTRVNFLLSKIGVNLQRYFHSQGRIQEECWQRNQITNIFNVFFCIFPILPTPKWRHSQLGWNFILSPMNEVWMIIMFSVIFRTFLKGSNGAFLVGMTIWCATFLFIYL